MAEEISPELIEKKKQYRLAMRNEYLKKFTSPDKPEGHIFDPAFQRFMSMKVTKIEHFRETPITILKGMFMFVIPLGCMLYYYKSRRDQKEALLRSGQVPYSKRLFKFQ
ncbi:unnamed protein product [Nezara viridula]|uniref:NADH dehydrogenase [ubiquinone] 1 beta subcomplex subunit 4 n=1 Tax=Nezara viridula TaxID=85310 RepID=A0A9P0GUP8_NEZVI|nr:unnamed protein product [Nezara viridula]